MAGAHQVIEISSSDEASSADSEPRVPRRQASRNSSSEEEKRQQRKSTKRRLVRAEYGRKKRPAIDQSESSESSGSELEQRLAELQRSRRTPLKKVKVAPTRHTRNDPQADGDMRLITEGMSFSELQAQQRMMERMQAQNRRKIQQKPQIETLKPSVAPKKEIKRDLSHVRLQTARKSAPMLRKETSSSSEESEGGEEWAAFTQKSMQRETMRNQKVIRQEKKMQESRVIQNSGSNRQTARKGAVRVQQKTVVIRPRKTKHVVARKLQNSSSEESESDSEESELESEQENERKSDEESADDDFELVELPREPKASTLPKQKDSTASVSKAQREHSLPDPSAQTDAQAVLRLHGTSETQYIKEKLSFRELQEQEKLMAFFRAQKRRQKQGTSGAASTARKGGHSTTSLNGEAKTSGSSRRARMGVAQSTTPDTSSSTSFISPPARNGLSASQTPSVSAADCTTKPAEKQKSTNSMIHSTAWRRLVFEEAPPNILEGVSTTPYPLGFDRPLWDYDKTGELKRKCKYVGVVGQGVALTEDNFELQPPSQSEVTEEVRELVDQELPYIKKCHARRVRHILRTTRDQLSEYLQANQVLRSERYTRLQWSEIANHQSWLDIAPIERSTAKRVQQSPAHIVHRYNYLAGGVRYFVYRDGTLLESLVYPETVTHLPNDIASIPRSFTMIGVRKNAFVENDRILRYVPYLGEEKHMEIDNDHYDGTTMSKERQIKVFGEGQDLKVLAPGAQDDEIMEYLLRVVVNKCGSSEKVFLALQHEAGFDRPSIDYNDMKNTYEAEQVAANRIAKVREIISLAQEASTDTPVTQVNAYNAIAKLAQPYWFLQDASQLQSLAVRLQPPVSVFKSNYAHVPNAWGLRDHETFEDLIGWPHRDLLCRRCYTYDCSEHGIQNPQRSIRADPVYPMINSTIIALAREDLPVEDNSENASSNSSSEIIELADSSSEDESRESKSQSTSMPQPEPQPATECRRSSRAQTRISSLATQNLENQEKLLESERLANQEKRRKKREKFAQSADNSEYLDYSYLPAVTSSLKKLLSKTQPCGSSCWISADDNEANYPPLTQVDSVLVRKLASSLQSNACVISAVLKSPTCTCTQIFRFLTEEKKRRDSGDLGADNLSTPSKRPRKGRHSSGVGSNRSLAKRVGEQRIYERDKKFSYEPCNHDGICAENCDCVKRRHMCGRVCSCPRDCPSRFQGCRCSMGNCRTSTCPCLNAGRECDPDYCFSCGASDAAVMAFHPEFKRWNSQNLNICQNVNMLRGSIQKNIGVAFSATHGWGAYALEPIRKDEFVLEYTGELITDEEAERRGTIYDRKGLSYLFGVSGEYVVDAAMKGNKAKFANHKEKAAANLDVKIISSNGEDRIGLFASEDIEMGAELFFDYGYTHENAPKWSQFHKPEPEKRVYAVVDDENEWE
ncbi:Histone-lysine N-methyltransferase EZH2 [Phytophthora citrophthora]|uniref:Histone-lysine N-methyltransferase EZH2 n=1 Tax=Phytophthora citrophthora TaxID=4793 RepID=A0AAD9H0B7_9STRA|nr:Histone-lysine N-methyltransferase EZH2 [Phytophthora citrophthora]